MSKQTKVALKYSAFVWLFTVCLAILVNCAPKIGADGRNGKDGGSCAVTQLANGAEIKCAGNTTAVILNGPVGPAGQDLTPGAYTVTGIVNPCGPQGPNDEVLLVLGNGSLLGHYSDGTKQFFSLLGAGNYITTDGTSCRFTVDASGNVTY